MYKYDDIDQVLVDKMMEMGFHISNKGFKYIIEAIKILHKEDDIKMMALYNEVAKKHNSSRARVEKNIRAEIERFYIDNNNNIPKVLVGDASTGKLANSEFIARLTNMLHSGKLHENA